MQQLGEAATQLTNIPTGTGKPLNLQYPAPLNAKKPTRKIKSLFPTALGTVDEPSSMIGVTFGEILDSKKAMDKVAEIADYYVSVSGPSTSEIGNVQNEV